MATKVAPTDAFVRDVKRLKDPVRKKKANDALVLFIQNKRHSGLNFERVKSKSEYFTIRCDRSDRILLLKLSEDNYQAVAVGNHDYIYHGYFKKR